MPGVAASVTSASTNTRETNEEWHERIASSLPVKPYYAKSGIVIIKGDCRDILPYLPKVDLVLTDPPYPDYYATEYKYSDGILDFLRDMNCRQLVFWTAKEPFPLDHTAVHIWDKQIGCASQYERIFERNGSIDFRMFNFISVNNTVRAQFAQDIMLGHPSQKPIKLLRELVDSYSPTGGSILDPFMGTGTTLVAAKQLGRKAIGIEIEEKYCQIAVERLSQEVLFTAEPEPEAKQGSLI